MAVVSGTLEEVGLTVPLDSEFWRGRRVLVTGHTGFKGAWLCLWLHRLGAQISGFALEPATEPNLYRLARLDELISSTTGDLRDASALRACVGRTQPEVVFHLGAQALVRPSYDDPVGTYASNVMGTVHLLDAVRHVGGIRAVVCVTSDKCYANQEWDWAYRESDAMGGHDPYSASKGCAELIAASYRESFFPAYDFARHGLALATARAGNVIGGGDWSPERLLPDLMTSARSGRRVAVRRPEATRPWQHVLDALQGYLLLAQRLHAEGPAFAEAWNFGPDENDTRSVRQVVQALARHLPLQCDFATSVEGPHEAASLRLDSAKARRRLGWRPAWNLDQALAAVADWHLALTRGHDARSLCLQQIDQQQQEPQETIT